MNEADEDSPTVKKPYFEEVFKMELQFKMQ